MRWRTVRPRQPVRERPARPAAPSPLARPRRTSTSIWTACGSSPTTWTIARGGPLGPHARRRVPQPVGLLLRRADRGRAGSDGARREHHRAHPEVEARAPGGDHDRPASRGLRILVRDPARPGRGIVVAPGRKRTSRSCRPTTARRTSRSRWTPAHGFATGHATVRAGQRSSLMLKLGNAGTTP